MRQVQHRRRRDRDRCWHLVVLVIVEEPRGAEHKETTFPIFHHATFISMKERKRKEKKERDREKREINTILCESRDPDTGARTYNIFIYREKSYKMAKST